MRQVSRKPVSRQSTHVPFLNPLAANFDKFFGPVLMVTYACLSNTLLLTGMPSYCNNYSSQRTDYFRSLSLGTVQRKRSGIEPGDTMTDPFSHILHDI
jgi:hypothetical protein